MVDNSLLAVAAGQAAVAEQAFEPAAVAYNCWHADDDDGDASSVDNKAACSLAGSSCFSS